MVTRQIYLVKESEPYYRSYTCEFKWCNGQSLQQKKKNVLLLHDIYHQLHPEHRILEISTASDSDLGKKLSAFNMMKHVPSLNRSIPLECVFQGGKVYEHGGPYLDMYDMDPGKANKGERKNSSGKVIGFEFEGKRFPTEPAMFFYDYLYLNELNENREMADQLLEYDGFTDIFFNPEKSINCQAISCAKYVSLVKAGKLEEYLDQQNKVIEELNGI